ncbi:condensation domain-containing protein [Streptomyces sp. NPDC037389]|uniref:condensation domain-containing protein n=1 Tax=Streptomyces sp. NPDC037389 TaxID=3155369 RepID=UPI003405E4E9
MTITALERPVSGSGPDRRVAPEGLPLTAAQSAMWHAQSLDPGSPALNTAEYLDIHGDVDPELFAEALYRVAHEADTLGVRIADTPAGPRQLPVDVPPPGHGFPLHTADLRAERDPMGAAHAWMRADLAVPFDLARGPLFAHGLLRVGERRWLWSQRVHHAVLDGYGHSLLARRTADVYTALAAGTGPGPGPFGRLAALVEEDAAYRGSAAHDRDREHWLRDAADGGPTLAGRTAPHSRTSLRSTAHLGTEETARLRELAASVRATWPDVLFAAQALYLSRATGSERVTLGLPMMGRMGSVALRIPGMVMNVLPLRFTVTPDTTFAELAHQADLGIRAARRHQRHRPAEPVRAPQVNVMPFDYGLTFAGAPSTAHNLSGGPVEDLTVSVYDRADGTGLRVDHDANPALYDARELAAHQRRFVDLLARLADGDPHRPLAGLGIATDEERARVLTEFNDTAVALPPTTLIGPVEARAARTPGAPALVQGALTLTYGELNARAGRLARHLAGLGVRPGTRAAVALGASAPSVREAEAVLAVLKAGGALTAPDDPAAVCVVTDSRHASPGTDTVLVVLDDPEVTAAVAAHPPVDPGRALTPQHPARVTGGTVVPHATIDGRLRWLSDRCGLTSGDRVLRHAPAGSEDSLLELLWPLREGATVVLPEAGETLARTIREQDVTTVRCDSSLLTDIAAGAGSLRRVVCEGGAPSRAAVDAFHRALPGVALHLVYGTGEAAGAAHHRCEPGGTGPVPLGRPAWNTRLYVLDAALQPCPPGVTGELYVAADRPADGRGERLVGDPFGPPGGRMHRTGHPARWTADGHLERPATTTPASADAAAEAGPTAPAKAP